MKIKLYQVDAFTSKLFGGNPAAVCPLDAWLPEETMQNIAMENNLAETAFYVKRDEAFEIRWFTPSVEVDLCGHATLAAAFVLYNFENYRGDEICFISDRSGELKVRRQGDLLTLNFPADVFEPSISFAELIASFNIEPEHIFKGKTDYMLVFKNEEAIMDLQPHLESISKLNCRGLIATAKGDNVDFVSRFFAPQSGVNEDPVTGSAHTTLTPYWAARLGKNELSAIQLSPRRGYLNCTFLNDRVEISGQAKPYLSGVINID